MVNSRVKLLLVAAALLSVVLRLLLVLRLDAPHAAELHGAPQTRTPAAAPPLPRLMMLLSGRRLAPDIGSFVFFPAMEFVTSLGVFGGSNALWVSHAAARTVD